jgi:uncharacterized protein YqeY
MSLLQQIDDDLSNAMKSKDEKTVSTLRMVKAALHNWQIANKKEPADSDIVTILQKEVKARQDSIAMYEKGGRQDLADKEKGEVEMLKKYLPEQMSEDEIRTKVQAVIAQVGASGPGDMGKVMGPIMAELKGQADGAVVSRLVKEELQK